MHARDTVRGGGGNKTLTGPRTSFTLIFSSLRINTTFTPLQGRQREFVRERERGGGGGDADAGSRETLTDTQRQRHRDRNRHRHTCHWVPGGSQKRDSMGSAAQSCCPPHIAHPPPGCRLTCAPALQAPRTAAIEVWGVRLGCLRGRGAGGALGCVHWCGVRTHASA